MNTENQLTPGRLELHVPYESSAEFGNWYSRGWEYTGWRFDYDFDRACFTPDNLGELYDLLDAWPRIWAYFERWQATQMRIDAEDEAAWLERIG